MKKESYYCYLIITIVFLIIKSNIVIGSENTKPIIGKIATNIISNNASSSFDSTKSMETKTTNKTASSFLMRNDKLAEDLEQGMKLFLRSLYLLVLFLPTLLLSPLAYGYPWFRMTVWFPLLRLTIAWSGAVMSFIVVEILVLQ